jgi:hypothetical protein
MVMRTTRQVLSSYAAAVRQETTHRTDTHRSASRDWLPRVEVLEDVAPKSFGYDLDTLRRMI